MCTLVITFIFPKQQINSFIRSSVHSFLNWGDITLSRSPVVLFYFSRMSEVLCNISIFHHVKKLQKLEEAASIPSRRSSDIGAALKKRRSTGQHKVWRWTSSMSSLLSSLRACSPQHGVPLEGVVMTDGSVFPRQALLERHRKWKDALKSATMASGALYATIHLIIRTRK